MSKILHILRFFLNKEITNFFLKLSNKIHLKGNFHSWSNAKKLCKSGYESEIILKKIKSSFVKSYNSKSLYERDGLVLVKKKKIVDDHIIEFYKKYFYKIKCNILDIGGGTGSIYFKNQNFFKKNKNINWFVYEQKKLVSFLKKKVNKKQIKFISSFPIDYKNKLQIILLQSSLQYFKNPYKLLKKIFLLNSEYIIIDEIPLTKNSNDLITVQVNPKKIYFADYPLYILSFSKIITFFKKKNYILINEKICSQGIGGYNYKCLVFKKIDND